MKLSRLFENHVIIQLLAIGGAILALAGGYFYFRSEAAVTVEQNDLRRGLVGHWSFDDGTGTKASDLSGNGNDGTLTNMEEADWTDGARDKSLSFDGTDEYVTVSDDDALDVVDATDLTLSGWFYRNTATTDDVIIAKRDGVTATDDGYVLFVDDSDDKLHFEVSDIADTDEYELASTSTFTVSGWHHFVVVWDEDSAANTELYLDGVADTATDTGTIANIGSLANALAFRIGAESDNGNPFDGMIDDVRIYNRALAQDEIADLYELTSTKLQTSKNESLTNGLVGMWSFDGPDISGATAYDRSGQGNNGTRSGASGANNTPQPVRGQVGQALDFDGTDDYVSVGNIGSGQKTISFWIQADDTTSRKVINIDGTDQIELDGSSTITATSFPNATVYVDGVIASVIDTGWHHITITDTIGVSTSVFEVGRVSSSYFDGRIDDVRIYNRALSAEEIQMLYNQAQ